MRKFGLLVHIMTSIPVETTKTSLVIIQLLFYFFRCVFGGCRISHKNDNLVARNSVRLFGTPEKGPLLDPNNYRMLAVSGTMYRMYANVIRSLLAY
jgi:hypothetical protein